MMSLLLLVSLLVSFSAASSDTGLVCAIDMGSHNFKLILGEMKKGKYVQHHYTKNRLAVGEDMSRTGVISPPKLKEIRQTLQKYLSTLWSAITMCWAVPMRNFTTTTVMSVPSFPVCALIPGLWVSVRMFKPTAQTA